MYDVSFQMFTVVSFQIVTLWVVALYRVVCGQQHFGETGSK